MKKFILHGNMADRFCSNIRLNASTMREVITALSANFPSFRSFYIQQSIDGIHYVFVDQSQNVLENYCIDIPLEGDLYHIVPSVQGAGMGLSFGNLIGGALAGAGLGWLADLIPDNEDDGNDGVPEYEIITTNSYIYSNNENTAQQGSPVPVVYGQLRVGSKIIQSSIQNYDYNYDDGVIYDTKPRGNKFLRINNLSEADYSVSETSNVVDLRNGTEESFKPFDPNDITKRLSTLSAPATGARAIHPKLENEPVSQFNDGGEVGPNAQVVYGPTTPEEGEVFADPGISWWDHSNNVVPRPKLFSDNNSIDKDMRPASADNLCIERPSINGVEVQDINLRCDAWTSQTQEMQVGSRGSYQKLESISMYKTLEVLSEGPIMGLASPVSDFDRDNGKVNYPYDAETPSFSAGSIAVDPLKFNAATNSLTSQGGSANLSISSAGSNYNDLDAEIEANGPAVQGLRLYIDLPSNSVGANIGAINFYDSTKTEYINYGIDNIFNRNNPHHVSSNGLFLLNPSNGLITSNNNTSSQFEKPLSSVYLKNEPVEGGSNQNVFQLSLLQRDSNALGYPFKAGNGLGVDGFTVTVQPESEDCKYEATLGVNSNTDRSIQAKVLDLSSFTDQLGQSNFESILSSDYYNRTANTVQYSNHTWDKMARIYYDGGAEIQENLNQSVTITLATRTRTVFSNGQWNTVTDVATTTITVEQYIGLASVTVSRINTRESGSWGDIYSELKNTNFTKGTTPESFDLDELINASASFANDLFDEINGVCNNDLNFVTFNGRKFPKFGIGSGSTIATGTKTGHLPTYTFSQNNEPKDNFESLEILNDGSSKQDTDTENPKGYYCPLIYPRVTIYTLRKKHIDDREFFDMCPTNIECVAEVSATGTINKLHVLKVPDLCVYDQDLQAFTPIIPHGNNAVPFGAYTFGPDDFQSIAKSIQDYGIICDIDSSNTSSSFNFIVNNGSLQQSNPLDRNGMHTNWTNYIKNFLPSPGFSSVTTGLIGNSNNINAYRTTGLTTVLQLDDSSTLRDFTTPDRFASVRIAMENLTLNSSYKKQSIPNNITGENWSTFYTGRGTQLTMNDPGSGYSKGSQSADGSIISFDIYNKTYGVNNLSIESRGKGYKPDSSFFIYGISQTKHDKSVANAYFNFKAQVSTDKFGEISEIQVIDPGFGFSSRLNNDDFLLHTEANTAKVTDAKEKGVLPESGSTENMDPDIHFTKRNLIFSIDDAHLQVSGREGSVSKFYISQTGLGFNFTQAIPNIFSINAFENPKFNVKIEDGALTSISVASSGSGYSRYDTNVRLKFSGPTSNVVIEDDVENDPQAWARSIFLNDTPIRDRNGRFNYSKFHFDMRIGHYKNGNGDTTIDGSPLADDAQSMLMNNEFRLPSNTTMVDFPLYGPRNNGEKDYYYTYTIKNPEVTTVSLNIQIDELNYLYEGDESAVYVNLIGVVAATLGIIAGTMIAKELSASLSAKDVVTQIAKGKAYAVTPGPLGAVSVTTAVAGCFGTLLQGAVVTDDGTGGIALTELSGKDLAKQAVGQAFYAGLAGSTAGFIISEMTKSLIGCSEAPFLCFKVGDIVKNSGEIWPAKLTFGIEHGTEGSELKYDTVIVRGCATNPYIKDIVIDIDPPEGSFNNYKNRILKVYRLTRETDPMNEGIVESRYKLKARVHSITEHIEGFFNYPNTALMGIRVNSRDHPNIPKREYLIKGRIVSVPSNYSEVDGTYGEGSWDGSFIDKWTSNPAWIIYDLLINERYGCGKYGITSDDIDKWSFYSFAQFCDERVDVTIDGVTREDGSVYQERRYMCNLYIDSEREAYEYIKDLLLIYNSSINFSGGKIYISSDSSVADSGSLMIFNNSNVSEAGFSYSSTPATSRLTAVSVDYVDERDNYIQKTEYVEDQQGINEYGYSHKRIAGNGITRKGEAHRLCWHKLLSRQLESEIIKFTTGLQASYLKVGDVISVLDNNKVSTHSGGRIMKLINNTTVALDVPSDVLSNVSNILISTNSSEGSQYTEYTISSKSGFNVSFSEVLDSSIDSGSNWVIKQNDSETIKPKLYRIKKIQESEDMQFDIICKEYIEDKYTQIDASSASIAGANLADREYSGHTINIP